MTAIAAAEKKKKRDEMYYKFNTSRGMGAMKGRLKDYDQAILLYTTAIENAEPGLDIPLIIARSKAHTRVVNHDAAREDALAAIAKAPEVIQTLENDAFTLYEKDDFEDALVRNYRGLRQRKKPPYFYKGILIGKETIEDCIGRNAGPCLDQDRLGQIIVDMHLKRRISEKDNDTIGIMKRKYEKERIDRFLAQKYLGRLAADKQFLKEFLKLPDLKSGNKEHNQQLESLISRMIDIINRDQETLITQQPMYMLKHHQPKFSKKFEEQRHKDEDSWRNGVMKIIARLLDEGEAQRKDRKLDECLSTCDRLRRFVECQPPKLLSESNSDKTLNNLYNLIGALLLDTKTFIPTWSDNDNELRIECILYSNINDAHFMEKAKETCYPRILNVKEMQRDIESKLSVSKHRLEKIFLYHEICRCFLEQGTTEKAYKAASEAYKLAKSDNNILWAFNTGFLKSLTVLMEGSVDDAKIGFTETMINARKLERDDCALFIQKLIKIATEPDRLDYEPPDPTAQREEMIVKMMPTPELKTKANLLIQKMAKAGAHSKLQLGPAAMVKSAVQGSSRRSMKIMNSAKRRTLHEFKTNRPDVRRSLLRTSTEEFD